jgi:peptide-methionine (S)-S-oxide reductase
VLHTRVGSAGGKMDKPTYHDLGGHTEAIQIEFDPKKVTFEQLLKIFWESHDECGRTWSSQYKAVLWTHGKAQAQVARASAAAQVKARGKKLTTLVAEAPRFWIAEDYHQKYNARRHGGLLSAVLGAKHTEKALRESTAVARINGWVAGHGSKEQILSESKALGFSAAARKELALALGRRAPVFAK